MRHGHISQRLLAKAEIELSKYGYHWALAAGRRARPRAVPRGGMLRVNVPAEIRSAYRRGDLKPGDLVEGEAILSSFAPIYRPRAYYPESLLARMPSPSLDPALKYGVDASPRVRPVVSLPRLAAGAGIAFLYPAGKGALERISFPGDLREALTRDYDNVPLVLPPGLEAWTGPCKFRARLQRLSDADALKLGGVAGPLYGTMEERGLTLFLSVEDSECAIDVALAGEREPLAGSLFMEARITGEKADAHLREALEAELPAAAEGSFGGGEAGQSTGIMSRLLALIQPPAIAVQRAPHLLSLFLPCNLAGEECADDFEAFAKALVRGLRRNIEAHGHDLQLETDFAYDCRRPFFRENGAMRTSLIDGVIRRRPHLEPVRDWLTGGE